MRIDLKLFLQSSLDFRLLRVVFASELSVWFTWVKKGVTGLCGFIDMVDILFKSKFSDLFLTKSCITLSFKSFSESELILDLTGFPVLLKHGSSTFIGQIIAHFFGLGVIVSLALQTRLKRGLTFEERLSSTFRFYGEGER